MIERSIESIEHQSAEQHAGFDQRTRVVDRTGRGCLPE